MIFTKLTVPSIERSTVALAAVILCISCAEKQQTPQVLASPQISPNGKLLATTSESGTTIYDLQTGKMLQELKQDAKTQEAVPIQLRFSCDSKYIATSDELHLKLWDLTTGKALSRWNGTNRWSFKMEFGGIPPLLAAREDRSLRVWDVKSQKLLLTIPLPYEMDAMAFSRDGKWIALAGTNDKAAEPRFHEIKIWEVPSGKLRTTLKGEYCIVKSLAFSPQGDLLATGLSLPSCRLWDLTTEKALWVKKVNSVDYDILAFSPDGDKVAIGGFQAITLLESRKGTVEKQFTSPPNAKIPVTQISGLVYLADPLRLVVGQKHGDVHSIDLTSGEWKTLLLR